LGDLKKFTGNGHGRIKVVWGPWLKLREGAFLYIYIYTGFLRRFRDLIRVPNIRENRVPTNPYRVPNIFLKKKLIYISFSLTGKKINERTEVFVLLKQKKLGQKKRIVN